MPVTTRTSVADSVPTEFIAEVKLKNQEGSVMRNLVESVTLPEGEGSVYEETELTRAIAYALTEAVDMTLPDTAVDLPPSDPSGSSDATFEFSATEDGCSFECRLDAESFAACASPMDFSGLDDGPHTLEVRAIDVAGKKGGEFYTPRRVVQLIVELLTPTEGVRICDPTVGSGGMLIESAKYVERHGGNPRNLSLFGQEKNLGTWAICKMNMLLHGLPDARIEKGDTLRDPKLVRDGELILFDRVIANPPFSLKDWGYEEAQHDGYGRFRYGLPPQTKGDLAFVQHMVATCNDQGMVGVVMPHGVLFRGGREEQIRRGMLEDDLFEAVIGLPPNLFYGTGIPATILVLHARGDAKPPERQGRVFFIHAAEYYEGGKNQNYLREEDIDRIVTAFREYKDVERFARVVDLDEIRRNDYNLNISRYVDTSPPEERLDVAEALARLRELERERDEAARRMDELLAELGYRA